MRARKIASSGDEIADALADVMRSFWWSPDPEPEPVYVIKNDPYYLDERLRVSCSQKKALRFHSRDAAIERLCTLTPAWRREAKIIRLKPRAK